MKVDIIFILITQVEKKGFEELKFKQHHTACKELQIPCPFCLTSLKGRGVLENLNKDKP